MGAIAITAVIGICILAVLLHLESSRRAEAVKTAERFRHEFYAEREACNNLREQLRNTSPVGQSEPKAERGGILHKMSGAQLRKMSDQYNADVERNGIPVSNSEILRKE